MIKRFAATVLLMLGLSASMLALAVAPAGAQVVSPASYGHQGGSSTTDPRQGGSSTTDPCLTGNGKTGTTNGNCFPEKPAASSGVTTDASQASQTSRASTTSASGGSGSLAFTGTDVIGTVIVAFLLIGGGVLVVRFSRRRTT
ncbi:MAG: hypothetical protein M3063_17100 [Actinomycetota bacterium]|nr:hypothetical protein [Actinomycetota bacterium]